MRRFRDPRANWIAVIALLAAVASLRGTKLLSSWYHNLGSRALSLEWPVVREAPLIAPCQQWTADPGAAQPVAQALRRNPLDERVRLSAGRVAWLLGDCETALDEWSSMGSGDMIGRLEHANALHALGHEEQAVALYREIPGITDYMHLRGDAAEASQDLKAAVFWYELGIEVSPTLATAQALAALYLQSEQRDAATMVWRRLSEGTPQADPVHWWALGQSAELAEDWMTAASAYGQGAALSADPCEFLERQEAALDQLEQFAAAEGVSQDALEACPERLWPYLRLGDSRRWQTDYAGALHWYTQAEVLWPEHASPKFYLGLIHFEQKRYEQAEMYFRQALALDPQHSWSMYHLAWCLHETEQKVDAAESLSRAIELDAGEPWRWAMLLGEWQMALGHREEALTAYRQALSWHPGDETIQALIDEALKFNQ
jgi:protein O-GlcNAc transferase